MNIELTILLFFKQSLAFIRPVHLFAAIILFSAMVLSIIVVMMMLLVRKQRLLKSRARISKSLEEWLTLIIIDDTMTSATDVFSYSPSIKVLLRIPMARQVLLNELISLRKNISGSSADNLREVYRQVNLQEETLADLKDKRWHKKVSGIQQLSVMQQVDFTDKIFRLTNHTNEYVRMESQLALVQMHGYKGLRFLSVIRHPLSDWQQLSLLHMLADKMMDDLTPVKKWLKSEEPSITCFALKLITMIQEHRFATEVYDCLNRGEESVLVQTLKCIDELGIEPSAIVLEHVYSRGTKAVQLELIRYVLKNNLEQYSHLYSLFQQNQDPEAVLLLTRANRHNIQLAIAV